VRRPVVIQSHTRTFASEIAVLGITLGILQILDGLLTGFGMAQFGIHMEGNALLRTLMNHVGYIPALILVKTVALGVILGLCKCAPKIRWLKHAFQGIIALYVVAAIIPWSVILTMEFLG
jgi:uncharacterized membrane protein SpoIIM required for sporulation